MGPITIPGGVPSVGLFNGSVLPLVITFLVSVAVVALAGLWVARVERLLLEPKAATHIERREPRPARQAA